MSLRIENIGALLSGDVRQPLLKASSLLIEDGQISAIAGSSGADDILDARGGLVAPGLWDAHHRAFFGDHTPMFDAHGYLNQTVRAGTTAIMSSGAEYLPGRARDARSTKYLAILSGKSWLLDRPLGMRVFAETVIAEPGLTEEDFADMASFGVRRVAFLSPLATNWEAASYAKWAHAHGMLVLARAGAVKLTDEATSIGDALRIIAPDVALHVNGGPVPPAAVDVDWLIEHSRCSLGLALNGSLDVARRVIARIVERGEPERIILGTDSPSPLGVMPAGVMRLVQLLVSFGAASAETAWAFASGNAARAFGLPGGRIATGQPADLVIAASHDQAPFGDAFEALRHGSWPAIAAVLLDGQVRVLDADLLASPTPANVHA